MNLLVIEGCYMGVTYDLLNDNTCLMMLQKITGSNGKSNEVNSCPISCLGLFM